MIEIAITVILYCFAFLLLMGGLMWIINKWGGTTSSPASDGLSTQTPMWTRTWVPKKGNVAGEQKPATSATKPRSS